MKHTLKTAKGRLLVLGAMLLALMASIAHGETNYWTGTGDGLSWEDAANWSLGQPVAMQDVATTNAAHKLLLAGETPILGSFTMNGGTLTMTNWATCLRAEKVTINKGLLTLPPAFTESQMSNRIQIACVDLLLAEGALIDVNGKGYASGCGPGKVTHAYASAGHGGSGIPMESGWGRVEQEYDDPLAPIDPGSGGSTVGSGGGAGGGVVWIKATGDVTLYGEVQANGMRGNENLRGAGAGGSIRIDCEQLFGGASGFVGGFFIRNSGNQEGIGCSLPTRLTVRGIAAKLSRSFESTFVAFIIDGFKKSRSEDSVDRNSRTNDPCGEILVRRFDQVAGCARIRDGVKAWRQHDPLNSAGQGVLQTVRV